MSFARRTDRRLDFSAVEFVILPSAGGTMPSNVDGSQLREALMLETWIFRLASWPWLAHYSGTWRKRMLIGNVSVERTPCMTQENLPSFKKWFDNCGGVGKPWGEIWFFVFAMCLKNQETKSDP